MSQFALIESLKPRPFDLFLLRKGISGGVGEIIRPVKTEPEPDNTTRVLEIEEVVLEMCWLCQEKIFVDQDKFVSTCPCKAKLHKLCMEGYALKCYQHGNDVDKDGDSKILHEWKCQLCRGGLISEKLPVLGNMELPSAAVDWTEEVLQGIVPSVLGVNITGTVFLGVLGVIADSLNHLVFTMPFLPSEGEKSKLLINGELKDVLVFHYLPLLWYRHSIPNELREFWYKDRPDILEYMQKSYQNLDIQFLPDNIEIVFKPDKLTAELIPALSSLTSHSSHLMNTVSSEVLSKTTENSFLNLSLNIPIKLSEIF